jgi:hypothetical protein
MDAQREAAERSATIPVTAIAAGPVSAVESQAAAESTSPRYR